MAQPPGKKFTTPFQRGWASERSMEETHRLDILLPGDIFTLPLIAWWLDLRRKKRQRKTGQQAHQPSCANKPADQFPENHRHRSEP